MSPPRELLEQRIERWVEDPEGSVEYAELVDGRWATRMRQEVRDATTVWWDLGQRTLRAEAYVLPPPAKRVSEVYRLCLVRNASTFRVAFALDQEEAIVLRSRVAVEHLTEVVLDQILGEMYEQVEVTFPLLVRLAFGSERENSP